MRSSNQITKVDLVDKIVYSLSKRLLKAIAGLQIELLIIDENYRYSQIIKTNLALRKTMHFTFKMRNLPELQTQTKKLLDHIDFVVLDIDEHLLNCAVINRKTPALSTDCKQLIESLSRLQSSILCSIKNIKIVSIDAKIQT